MELCVLWWKFRSDNAMISKFKFFLIIVALLFIPQDSSALEYNLHHNPKSSVFDKLKTHDIVLLGTRHKQPHILEVFSELITVLHNSEITHIG